MPIIKLKDNESFDSGLRRFKRSCDKAGIISEIRKREFYEIWFRIRVGSYDNRETAIAVAQSLSKSRRETAWVDFVRYEN